MPHDPDVLIKLYEIDQLPGDQWTSEHFDVIYHAYAGRYYGLFVKRLNNEADAKDATQQIFAQLWEYRANYDPTKATGGVAGYLFTTARRVQHQTLNKIHPITLKIKCDEKATMIVGQPFVFEFMVSPAKSCCTLVRAPTWLTLEEEAGQSVKARRQVNGIAPSVGEWSVLIGASHWEKEFCRAVRFRAISPDDPACLTMPVPCDPSKAKAKGVRAHHENFEEAEPMPEDGGRPTGLGEHVEWLLSTLPDRKRYLLEMRYLEGKSPEEIAALTGKQRSNTVSVAIKRALADLRRTQEDEDRRADGHGPVR